MIYVGADHKGLFLKSTINTWLRNRGFEFEDLGGYEYDPEDDYVDVAIMVGIKTAGKRELGRGIVICGSGVGVDVAANKVEGVRCGLGFVPMQVESARRDDNINVLALSAEYTDGKQAILLVERFLLTEFLETERYLRRIDKIARYEQYS